MSKPVKNLITKEYIKRFEGVDSVAVVSFTGVDANANADIRSRLREKDIQVTVVKNSLAKKAFREVGLDSACGILDGPCAVAWGADSVVSVVRELLDIRKEQKALDVRGAVMEGNVFPAEQVEALSKFPTRDEAIAEALGCALSAGANLAGCLMGPAGALAGVLKTIEEKGEQAA